MNDFWDVASAIATVVATGLALGLSWREARLRRLDAEDQRAAQARMVVSTIEGSHATIINHSGAPLLELRMIRADADANGGPVAVRWNEEDTRVFRNVAAGQAHTIELRVQGWGPVLHPVHGYEQGVDEGVAPHDATNHRLTIQFLDVAGLWWQRVGLQPPTRVMGEPAEPEPNPE
ncbi:hypothetical protein ABZT23_40015 [Streptomyces sp. NPDC005386]|uniref:hypothetical protein n=1 Tax=Streptomyces sp. NPDC005386 TaxID=3154562 RepID=UPI0033A68692